MFSNSKQKFTFCQRFLATLCALVCLTLAFAPNTHAKQLDLPTISVLADPSLTVPLTHIARDYSSKHHALVTVSYGSTADQSLKIEMGEEADIFISPQPRWITHLTNQGVVDVYSRTTLARNQLALSAGKDSPLKISLIKGLALDEQLLNVGGENARFVVGDPQFLDHGSFALESLTFFGLLSRMEPLFEFPRSPKTMYDTLAEPGNAGLLYVTDVVRNPSLKVIDIVPDEAHAPIVYEAVVIASKDMQPARDFLAYLQSDAAMDVLEKHGFEKVDE